MIDERIPCDICGRIFKSRNRMLGHYWQIHHYGKERKYKSNKLQHPELYYNLETMECKICHTVVKKDKKKYHYLSKHAKEEEKPKKLSCPHCDMEFSHKNFVNQHIEFKHTKWTISCELCSRMLPNNGEKNRHMKESHNVFIMNLCHGCKLVKPSDKRSRLQHHCQEQNFESILVKREIK